jgi:NAD-dependent SIR2 family protein deacetylase
MPAGAIVYTANVDGHFRRAGFDAQRVLEVHGTIEWLQCTRSCGAGIFSAEGCKPDIYEETMRGAAAFLPEMRGAGRLRRWPQEVEGKRLMVVECSAGAAVPTVRHSCKRVARTHRGRLVRINVREPQVPPDEIWGGCNLLADDWRRSRLC